MTQEALRLERVTPENHGPWDGERLMRWISSEEELVRWAGTSLGFPFTSEEARRPFEQALAMPEEQHAFRVRVGEAVVGHIELRRINREHGTARVGRVLLDPARRGQGLGRAMLQALVDHAFGELGLRRLDLRVFPDNAAARRCYEAVGFVQEGVEREALRIGAVHWDLVSMGMLRKEWKGPTGGTHE
jgi:RimJ/RimL family protein N-acetyltransferase